ncbi:hypothetical protein OESDEN_06164 [Oesophagostomum dentatum]|uniref:VWFA domain-containing protein n=1 Tax=Oesophagostomum dentatum TaxID=61180 RepID=A0A0B1T9J0_OESDE|nr:hypothetical protein OESDEN_06164 [Oesophagostomum dentatum]
MTSYHMDNAVAFILGLLRKMTIGHDTAEMMKTRAGFIRFASAPQLLYSLSHWKSTSQLIEDLKIDYDGGDGANIKAAIRLAAANFRRLEHRPGVKKVIVILASSEHEENVYIEARKEAEKFKANGGEIVTIGR